MGRLKSSWTPGLGPKTPPAPPAFAAWAFRKITGRLGHDDGIAFRYCSAEERGKLAGLLRGHVAHDEVVGAR